VSDLLTHEGQAYLSDPSTGETVVVPVDQAREGLTLGLVPASREQYSAEKEREHYGSTGMRAAAGLAGLGRGLTFGLSDVLATGLGNVAPESLRKMQEHAPITSGVGELGGTLASFAIPGGAGAGVLKAGAKVGGKAAGALAARAPRLAKLAGSAAEQGAVGAALGVGHAVSDIAVQELDAQAAAARLQSGLTHGAAFGAGLGVLAFGGRAAGRAVHRKVSDTINKARSARAQVDSAQAELQSLKQSATTSMAPMTRQQTSRVSELEGIIAKGAPAATQFQSMLVGDLSPRLVAGGLAVALDGGVTGGLLGAVVAPRLLDGVKKAIAPRITAAVKSVASSPWARRAPAELGNLATRKIVPLAKVAALDAMTDAEWAAVAKEIPKVNPESLESLIQIQTPTGTPDNIKDSLAEQVSRALSWAQEQAPKRDESDIPSGSEPKPSPQQAREYAEKVKAVFLPDSLLQSFMSGNAASIAAGVQAWQAVRPAALEQLRAVMQASVDEATAKGHRYSRREAHKIALVTGDRGPRMYDAQRVAMLQAQYQGQKQRGPKPRARQMSGLDSAVATPTQRALT